MLRLDIGELIVHLREEKKITQKELAKRAGLSSSGLSEIESGKKMPRFATLEKIASALDMDVAQLLSYKEENDLDKKPSTIENISEEIAAWLKTSESMPYILFAYKISKQVPANLLGNIKFLIDINNGGAKS